MGVVANVVPFTENAIRAYLEACIEFWRGSHVDYAAYYVDAFQSMHCSLFGETCEIAEKRLSEPREVRMI